jgi:hypothetical protein
MHPVTLPAGPFLTLLSVTAASMDKGSISRSSRRLANPSGAPAGCGESVA